MPYTTHSYAHDPAASGYAVGAADKLAVEAARVFKTLIVQLDGALAAGIVPASGTLDLKALADALGGKRIQLAGQRDAERRTGYVVGGISPIGQRTTLPTVVDASALAHPTVFVSGGRRGFEIELAPADLVAACSPIVAPIGR